MQKALVLGMAAGMALLAVGQTPPPFELDPGAFQGIVMLPSGGTFAEGAIVTLEGVEEPATTDERGWFSMPLPQHMLPYPDFRPVVEIEYPPDKTLGHRSLVHPENLRSPEMLRLRNRASALRGNLADDKGEPVPDQEVALYWGILRMDRTSTDSAGAFQFNGVYSGMRLRVEAGAAAAEVDRLKDGEERDLGTITYVAPKLKERKGVRAVRNTAGPCMNAGFPAWPLSGGNADAFEEALSACFEVHTRILKELSGDIMRPEGMLGALGAVATPFGKMPFDQERTHAKAAGRTYTAYQIPLHPMVRKALYLRCPPLAAQPSRKPDIYLPFFVHSSPDRAVCEYVMAGETGDLAAYAVFRRTEGGWRALEYCAYPNGFPHYLACWEDGRPAGGCVWTLEGVRQCYEGAELPWGDPRLHPDMPASAPPEAYGEPPAAPPETVVCTVRAALCGANRPGLALPAIAVYAMGKGQTCEIPAPHVAPYVFQGWSGAATGDADPLRLTVSEDMELVAEFGGEVRFEEPALEEAVRASLGIPEDAPIRCDDLARLTALDASGRDISDVGDLLYCSNLRELDLSGNNISSLETLDNEQLLYKQRIINDFSRMDSPLNRLLAAFAYAAPPAVHTLNLDGNPLKRVLQMPLRELRRLSMRDARLQFPPRLGDQPVLESLLLDGNEIHTAGLYIRCPALEELSYKDNQVTEVSLYMPKTPAREGMRLILTGNPLSDEARLEAIPKMEALGIEVVRTGDEAVAELKADPDGDGYINADEKQFVSLFHIGAEAIEKAYGEAIADPETPREYLEGLPHKSGWKRPGASEIDMIPVEHFEIFVQGAGQTDPPPGRYRLARYGRGPDGDWTTRQLTVTATPAPGWRMEADERLREYPCDSIEVMEQSIEGGKWRVTLEDFPDLRIRFFEVGGLDKADLLGDFIRFAETLFPGKNPAELDCNEIDYAADGSEVPVPNGIPDGAEIRLLQELLNHPEYRLEGRCYFGFELVKKVWQENEQRAREVIGALAEEHPFLVNMAAAYATIGDWFCCQAFERMVNTALEVEIEMKGFDNGLAQEMAADAALTCEGHGSNRDLWKRVARGHEPDLELFGVYAEAVLTENNLK